MCTSKLFTPSKAESSIRNAHSSFLRFNSSSSPSVYFTCSKIEDYKIRTSTNKQHQWSAKPETFGNHLMPLPEMIIRLNETFVKSGDNEAVLPKRSINCPFCINHPPQCTAWMYNTYSSSSGHKTLTFEPTKFLPYCIVRGVWQKIKQTSKIKNIMNFMS